MLMYYVKQALWLTMLIGAPIILFTMITGLLLGFLQAVFQLQDQAFPFAIKLTGCTIILIVLGPWMADNLMQFSEMIFTLFNRSQR
ncbi:MAG: type III secretion system export apparatus subunit SctS [Limnobacter sp.]|uniref:type III secretion system export apparatus subunit SctS n=1 Tax=Limnobacter sp. TaxID=2003368 RepID=UPI0032F02E53